MNHLPLVSLIIPTYNRAHLIGQTLDSVLVQTYTNWECIVVDDGSSDDTEKVLQIYQKKDTRFVYYNRPLDTLKGASSSRNYGLQKATGAYVIFLDSDDLLLDYCLLNRVKVVLENLSCDFWVFPMYIERGEERSLVSIPYNDDYLIDFLSCNLYWQTMCTMWKLEFVRSIGGFNPEYPRLNDPEIHIKALIQSKGNYLVCNNTVPDSVYRETPIKDKALFVKNYLSALHVFIPDISGRLVAACKTEQRYFLRGYLEHYMKDFKHNTTWRQMVNLFGVFYACRVIGFIEYYSRLSKYLGAKLFRVIFKMIKH